MMLEPVQKASGRSRKLNSVVDQRIHSSAQPARCSAISDRSKTNSSTKSRSLETSRLLAATRIEAELLAHAVAIDRQRRAGQGRGSQRQHIDALAAIGQAVAVALIFLDVGQEIMGRQHRLGPLQVRVAGQDQVAIALGVARAGPAAVRASAGR